MEKGQGKGTDTLQTDKVFTRKEYIEREAAYNALTDYYHHRTDTQHEALREALSRVPAADVAPVVRCKDCKYRHDDDFCGGRGWPAQLVPDDGYCDNGARKDGDGE